MSSHKPNPHIPPGKVHPPPASSTAQEDHSAAGPEAPMNAKNPDPDEPGFVLRFWVALFSCAAGALAVYIVTSYAERGR